MKKIAIIHDDFMQYGGAEKLVASMLEVFPQADIYTSVYSPKILKRLKIPAKQVTASFMQRIPFKKLWYKSFFFLYPLAFEWLSSLGQLDKYQVVVSSSARFAHGVLTKPSTTHIAYINSPGRMWWEPHKYFSHSWQEKLFMPFARWLKFWDKVAMSRVDVIVANSKNVATKIEACYGKKPDAVIYPFCMLPMSPMLPTAPMREKYFLIVTRLSPWKRVDIAVKAFAKNPALGNLVVVGAGHAKSSLIRLAGGASNISFVGQLTNKQLGGYYKKARALIVTQEEDFGITPLEAMAWGIPVVAFGKGGVLESVVEGKHGVFFKEQTADSLAQVLRDFSQMSFSKSKLKRQAEKFGKDAFQSSFKKLVEKYV